MPCHVNTSRGVRGGGEEDDDDDDDEDDEASMTPIDSFLDRRL